VYEECTDGSAAGDGVWGVRARSGFGARADGCGSELQRESSVARHLFPHDGGGGGFALASAGGESSAMPTPAGAEPAAKPKYIFGERDDYRWQLELGVEYFRFRSNIFDASMVGTNTTLTYWTNGWFGGEGSGVTGVAPEIYDREQVK